MESFDPNFTNFVVIDAEYSLDVFGERFIAATSIFEKKQLEQASAVLKVMPKQAE